MQNVVFSNMEQWSTGRRNQLHKITRRLLEQDPETQLALIDLITVIHGYEQLATEHPEQPEYWLKFRDGIARLVALLVATGKTGQANRLKSLAKTDKE